MTTPPTNDATGKKPYWCDSDGFIRDLNNKLVEGPHKAYIGEWCAMLMNLAHAAREPEIAELQKQIHCGSHGDACPLDKSCWWHRVDVLIKERDAARADIARLTADAAKWKAAYDAMVNKVNLREADMAANLDIKRGMMEQINDLSSKLAACEKERDEARRKLNARDWAAEVDTRVVSLTASLRVATEALEEITRPISCGCKPCVGQCRSEPALSIELDAIRDIADTALRTIRQGETKPPCPTCGDARKVSRLKSVPCPTCCPTPAEFVAAAVNVLKMIQRQRESGWVPESQTDIDIRTALALAPAQEKQ